MRWLYEDIVKDWLKDFTGISGLKPLTGELTTRSKTPFLQGPIGRLAQYSLGLSSHTGRTFAPLTVIDRHPFRTSRAAGLNTRLY